MGTALIDKILIWEERCTMDLKECRVEIDSIDSKIIELFEQRMEVCARVADYKLRNNLPVLDKAREDEKMEALKAMMSDEMQEYGERLYSSIFELSREYQSKILKGVNGDGSD